MRHTRMLSCTLRCTGYVNNGPYRKSRGQIITQGGSSAIDPPAVLCYHRGPGRITKPALSEKTTYVEPFDCGIRYFFGFVGDDGM